MVPWGESSRCFEVGKQDILHLAYKNVLNDQNITAIYFLHWKFSSVCNAKCESIKLLQLLGPYEF